MQSVKVEYTKLECDLESKAFHVVFVSDSVSFGCSSSLSTSVNLHALRSRWQATKIVLEFARANFWLWSVFLDGALFYSKLCCRFSRFVAAHHPYHTLQSIESLLREEGRKDSEPFTLCCVTTHG